MIIPRVEIQLYKRIAGEAAKTSTYETTPRYIVEYDDITIQKGLSTRKDTFKFNIRPAQNGTVTGLDGQQYISYTTDTYMQPGITSIFSNGDRVKIYAWTTPTRPNDMETDALLMDGLVANVELKHGTNDFSIDVGGNNRTELLLNALVPALFTGTDSAGSQITKPANQMIKEIITTANSYMGADSAFIISADIAPLGSIVASKSDGTAFPNVPFAKGYRPLYQQIEDISLPAVTGDDTAGAYFFEINNQNQLVWSYRNFSTVGSLNENNYLEDSLQRDDNVVNAYIINAGVLPDGGDVGTFVIDAQSVAENGAKFKFLPLMDVCKTLREAEAKIGPLINTGKIIGPDGYPTGSPSGTGYPWRMQGEDVDITQGYLYTFNGNTITVNSDDEFRDTLRDQSIASAQKIGYGTLKITKIGKRKFNRTIVPGTLAYVPGTLYTIVLPSTNMSIKLRLVDIQHRLNKSNGWITYLSFEQDEKEYAEAAVKY